MNVIRLTPTGSLTLRTLACTRAIEALASVTGSLTLNALA